MALPKEFAGVQLSWPAVGAVLTVLIALAAPTIASVRSQSKMRSEVSTLSTTVGTLKESLDALSAELRLTATQFAEAKGGTDAWRAEVKRRLQRIENRLDAGGDG